MVLVDTGSHHLWFQESLRDDLQWRIDSRRALLGGVHNPQAIFMSAAVAVPEAEVVSWPVAPVLRPAVPEPMWSAYHVVFTGWLFRF